MSGLNRIGALDTNFCMANHEIPQIEKFTKDWEQSDPLDFPLLKKFRDDVEKRKPFRGLRILHNNPLTLDAIFKIEPLVLGGAEVTVTSTTSIKPQGHDLAVTKLQELGIAVDLGRDFPDNHYDIILDCCGELANVKPSIGAVELTRSGQKIYEQKELDYPVISIDDSLIKRIETFFGTGDACVSVLKQYLDVCNERFLIFGYGKVGKGVVHALQSYTTNIVVVDIDKDVLAAARDNEIEAINFFNSEDTSKCIDAASVIITSTGIEGFISKHFKHDQFVEKCLVNIGALDEYGDQFEEQEVLNGKQPLNFGSDEANKRCFLDPPFYAHNIASELLLGMASGLHQLPNNLDLEIVNLWERLHNSKYVINNIV